MKIGFFDDFKLGVVKGDTIVDLSPLFEDIHVHAGYRRFFKIFRLRSR